MKIGPRTAKLLREAIVLAHVEGYHYGQGSADGDEYPKDSEVVSRVLSAATRLDDVFPTLAKLDVAQEANAERRRTFVEDIKQLMAQRQEEFDV